MALLPESAAEHHLAPGVRFVPVETAAPAFESAVITRPDTESLATLGFLRTLSRVGSSPALGVPRPAVSVAA